MKRTLIILAIIITSCNNKNAKTELTHTTNKIDTILKEVPKEKVKYETISQIYQLDNDTLFQEVELKKIEKGKIDFVIISKSKTQNNTEEIQGIAFVSEGSDVEFEEDEEGNAIPVTEYLYKNENCWISLKIDMENKNFLKLREADCNVFNKTNSLNTGVFLTRK
ncbi:hypothetical protein BWK59_11300 [Flavobacterium davisii]|uniref:Lipoprotein n=1 Tax=Flavobacterium davisii TaxID=2906077 RepID=A0A2D0AIC1_9FLAO|nr:hypothetical protein [Flavobacterium davisii]OWP83290.1 hypothetical protein BWK59_11300 [Flavobacterium davisii]